MILDITPKEFKEVHESHLDLDLLYALRIAKESPRLFSNREDFQVLSPKLIGLAYLNTDLTLTTKSEKTLQRFFSAGTIRLTSEWIDKLHETLQQKMVALTGKRQKTLQGGKYSFLCNKVDLGKKLDRVWKKYGALDLDKVQITLLAYMQRCNRAGWDKVTLIENYIIKDDVSRLITDMDGISDQSFTAPDGSESKPLIDPKDMF